jgi:hypothetical protein
MAKSRLAIVVLLSAVATASVVGVNRRNLSIRRAAQAPSGADLARRREAIRARTRRLAAKVLARLDEVEQFDDELADQKLVSRKATDAVELAKRELDLAEKALKEYQEFTHPQELAASASDIAHAEAEVRVLSEQVERSRRLPNPDNPSEGGYAELALGRAKATLDQAKAKRDAAQKLTNPRRLAELSRDIEHARAEVTAKQGSLAFEKEDEAKLERQLREGELNADERDAIKLLDTAQALLARLGSHDDAVNRLAESEHLISEIEAVVDRAEAEWKQAESARAEHENATTHRRIHAAARGEDARR